MRLELVNKSTANGEVISHNYEAHLEAYDGFEGISLDFWERPWGEEKVTTIGLKKNGKRCGSIIDIDSRKGYNSFRKCTSHGHTEVYSDVYYYIESKYNEFKRRYPEYNTTSKEREALFRLGSISGVKKKPFGPREFFTLWSKLERDRKITNIIEE